MPRLKPILSILVLLLPALMSGFTLSVTPATETCSGNATLNFAVVGTAPGGSIEYFIYKLPNATVPYASTTAAFLGGLTAGNYRVVAVETVGGTTTQQQQDVTITSAIVPLEFTVQSLNQACASVSNISVNVTSGNAVSFEIFEGPVTFASQPAGIFNNLPVGVYKIRVFDACGIGVVSTFTVTLNPTGLNVAPPVLSNTSPPSCTSVIASHTVTPSPGTVIAYPLNVLFTIHPPGGGPPSTISQTINSGDALTKVISATLPLFIGQDYDYDLSITDACGTQVTGIYTISRQIALQPNIFSLVCNDNYFELKATNFTPPYTLNFSAFPPGFDPAVFNAQYPGPFSADSVTFGSEAQITPLGTYTVTIADVCGQSKTITFDVLDIPPAPTAVATNNGCLSNSGKIVINIPHYKIATAVITSAPAAYPGPLPSDVSSFIDAATGILTLPSVPLGDYTIALTDFCSSSIAPINVSIPAYVSQPLVYEVRPGCELQKSSLRVTSGNNAKLVSLTITAAPAGFGFALPYNGAANLTALGEFYIKGLPAGTYHITGTDACGFTDEADIPVDGYAVTSSSFSLQTNCGTFDIALNFISNGTAGETFWLQKQLTPAGSWGHPLTDVPYAENSIPDATNSYALANNTTNFNLAFNGVFRIVRSFYTFNSGAEINAGAAVDKNCIEILDPTLQFDESLEILDAYRMPCSASGSLDVIVEVNGALPLHYTITEKDGLPFSLGNATSNVFSNLPAGVYTFQVEDNCGNIVTRIFDVAALGSLININKPGDLLNCVASVTGNETFDLSAQNAVILGTQSPAAYTLKYYATQQDAQAQTNPIGNLNAFNPQTNPQTVYAAVTFNELPNCYELTSFDLYAGQTPTLNLNATYLRCSEEPVVINAAGTNLPTTTYLWSNGSTDPEVTITGPGVTPLTVTATNSYGTNLSCTTTREIEVVISKLPAIDRIETVDWTENDNTITIVSSTPDQFEYAIDGSSFQDNNVFLGLQPGLYTVTIRDRFGCGSITKEVWLLNYPKFFTPNGDGFNDLWFIENSQNEPDFNVQIFDRFGKLLKVFTSKESGWDGKYNGREIFSDDYWFVVHRQDGKIYKGHFALKR